MFSMCKGLKCTDSICARINYIQKPKYSYIKGHDFKCDINKWSVAFVLYMKQKLFLNIPVKYKTRMKCDYNVRNLNISTILLIIAARNIKMNWIS